VLDPVLVWFLTIRYDLPIPALILDEALAILGPFSDILRLAGAVFIKRDPFARSNLSSAVTCAYLNHLLEERGAMTLVLEKVRSRTGVSQPAFDDGILDMISDNHDVVFVPINISYEEVPDISVLVGQDLFSAWKSEKKIQNRMSTPAKMTRPSDSRAQRVRSRSLGNGVQEDKAAGSPLSNHFGRLLVGISDAIMLTDFKEM
jgi:hypothetical protein